MDYYRVKIIDNKKEYNFFIKDNDLPREGDMLDILKVGNSIPKRLYQKTLRVESVRKRLALHSSAIKKGETTGTGECLENLVVARVV